MQAEVQELHSQIIQLAWPSSYNPSSQVEKAMAQGHHGMHHAFSGLTR
jgi:hypothetical protein